MLDGLGRVEAGQVVWTPIGNAERARFRVVLAHTGRVCCAACDGPWGTHRGHIATNPGEGTMSATDELRLAVNKSEAASALGVSVDFFDDHVSRELPCIRRGRRQLYPVSAIERWLERSAEKITNGGRHGK